jgi:hypothetical protein
MKALLLVFMLKTLLVSWLTILDFHCSKSFNET